MTATAARWLHLVRDPDTGADADPGGDSTAATGGSPQTRRPPTMDRRGAPDLVRLSRGEALSAPDVDLIAFSNGVGGWTGLSPDEPVDSHQVAEVALD